MLNYNINKRDSCFGGALVYTAMTDLGLFFEGLIKSNVMLDRLLGLVGK